ncbi:MAG: acylphosphatase [Mitsuokella sp.]|uniref:acylphosphatase n=1 Tax=Mitsuokella sp. TaxID=2049034 RepID=UPI003F01DEA6
MLKRWLGRRGGRNAVLAAILLLLLLPLTAEASGRVESVDAHVTAETGMPPLVKQRMETSVRVIAEQLLLGMPADASAEELQQKSEVIRQVFDKVLVGYTVRQVEVTPDDAQGTSVTVRLMPWSDQIRNIEVKTNVEGMPPAVEALIRQDLADVNTVFSDALYGLPVAATDWTNGVLKHHLNDYLAVHLPEFRGDFEVETDGDKANVSLTVYPRLPVVRTTDLSMRSDTIPNFALLNHRELMQQQTDMLVGVPVAFVARHQHEFEQMFAKTLDAQQDFRALRMTTSVTITPHERMEVMSRSNSDRYRARLLGWVDMGRRESKYDGEMDSLRFRLHAGSMLTSRDEAFAQFDFMPQKVDWGWELGYGHRFGMGTVPQVRYDMRKNRFVLGALQTLAPRWQLRYEYRFADQLGEAGLLYKVHDFLSLEYVLDKTQGWLRLIGNF